MLTLSDLPLELVDAIIGLLELGDISNCVKTCKTFQALLEPYLFRDLVFLGDASSWTRKASFRAVKANPIRLFFRSLVARPALGRHLQHLQYSGPSRGLQTHKLVNPRQEMHSNAFRGPDKWRILTVQQAVEEELSSIFEKGEIELLWQLNTQRRRDPTAATPTIIDDDDNDEMLKEPVQQAYWPFPEMMVGQGVMLSILDFIILLSPNLRSISLSINTEREQREPFRLYSLSLASQTSHSDWLTRCTTLSNFQFAVLNPVLSNQNSALHAQDMTNLMSYGNLTHLGVRNLGLQRVSWPGKQSPALGSLKYLILSPTFPRVELLTALLSETPVLASLEYHISVDVEFEASRHIDCEGIHRALSHVQESLERMELYFGTELSACPHPVDDYPGAGVIGRFGSLSNFQKLHSLVISLAMLVGPSGTSQHPRQLASILPHTLQRLYLIEENDGLGYDWDSNTTRVIYTDFLATVQETHPDFCYFRLLSDSFHYPTLPERQAYVQLKEECLNQGITFNITSVRDWESEFPFEGGISGFI